MKYIANYEYNTDSAGRIIWARDMVTGRFVKHSLIKSLLSNEASEVTEAIICLAICMIANILGVITVTNEQATIDLTHAFIGLVSGATITALSILIKAIGVTLC